MKKKKFNWNNKEKDKKKLMQNKKQRLKDIIIIRRK